SVMQLCTLGKKLSVKMLDEYCKAVGLCVPVGTLRADLRYMNMQASGEARWDRHQKNTWHGKKRKLHTVMTGVSAAGLEAGAVVASEVVEARLCAKFHSVKDFDGDKKSCRKRLSQHNARRRRKPCDESENDDENDDATDLLLSSSSSHASPSIMMGTSTCSCPDTQPHLGWQLPGALHSCVSYSSTAAPPSLTFGKAQRLGSLSDLSDGHGALPGCVTEPAQHYSLGTMAFSAPHCHILGPDKSRPGCQQYAAGQHPKGFSARIHAGRVCKTRSRGPSLSLLQALQNHGQPITPDELAEMLHGQGDHALQLEPPVDKILSSHSAHTRPAFNSLPSVPGTGAMCIDGSSSCTDDSGGIGRYALTALPVNWPLSRDTPVKPGAFGNDQVESPGCMPLVRKQQPRLLAQQRQPYSPAVMQGMARAQGNATLASSVPLPVLADLHPSDSIYHAEGVSTAPLSRWEMSASANALNQPGLGGTQDQLLPMQRLQQQLQLHNFLKMQELQRQKWQQDNLMQQLKAGFRLMPPLKAQGTTRGSRLTAEVLMPPLTRATGGLTNSRESYQLRLPRQELSPASPFVSAPLRLRRSELCPSFLDPFPPADHIGRVEPAFLPSLGHLPTTPGTQHTSMCFADHDFLAADNDMAADDVLLDMTGLEGPGLLNLGIPLSPLPMAAPQGQVPAAACSGMAAPAKAVGVARKGAAGPLGKSLLLQLGNPCSPRHGPPPPWKLVNKVCQQR
ncbi:hypothetical protein QJQ45_022377, partial [Haematococcus lacustris]